MKALFYPVLLFGTLCVLTNPANAQWVPTSGPEGGWIYSLAAQGASVFAATDNGMFRSANNGASWSPANVGITNLALSCVRVDGSNVYAAGAGLIFRSTDDGASWTGLGTTGLPLGYYIHGLGFIGSNLFAGFGGRGVYRSTDAGATWTACNAGLPDTTIYVLKSFGSSLFAGTQKGLFRSTDNGSSWTPANAGLPAPIVSALVATGGGGTLVAGLPGPGTYASTDNGATWTKLGNMPHGNVNCLVSDGTDLIAGAGDGISRSTDSGVTWVKADSGLIFNYVLSLCKSGTRFVAGTMGGAFVSTDTGQSWRLADAGLVSSSVTCLAMDGSMVVAGTDGGGVYRSSNNGMVWESISAGLSDQRLRSLLANGPTLFAGTWDLVYRSTDHGLTWHEANIGRPMKMVNALVAAGPSLFAAGDGGVWLSSDNGSSWTSASTGLPANAYVYCMTVNGGSLLVGLYGQGVYTSTDNGAHWNVANTGLGISYVYGFAVTPGKVFAGGENGVSLTTNNGASWTKVTNGLVEYPYIHSMLAVGNRIFAGAAYDYLFFSEDNGAHWTKVGEGLPGPEIVSLALDGTDLLAGTNYCGVWRRPLAEIPVSVSHDRPEAPLAFGLEQNYPNPFNPTTRIRYTVARVVAPSGAPSRGVEGPAARKTRLVVYDLLGRQVATLVNEEKAPGSYEVTLDGSGLASGVYIYRMTAGSYVRSRTMVLVR